MGKEHLEIAAIKERRRIIRGIEDVYEQWLIEHKEGLFTIVHEAFRACLAVANDTALKECKCSGCIETTLHARGYCENCWDLDCDLDGSDNH